MNERIKELSLQASDSIPDDVSAEHAMYLFQKKFAELIVKECSKKGFDIFDEEPDAPASDLQFYVRDGIKKHFEVE